MYDYSETEYINNDTKVAIICKKHGAFYQLPRSHISSRAGCAACNEVDFWDINNLTELQKLAPNGLYVMYMRSEDHSEEHVQTCLFFGRMIVLCVCVCVFTKKL